MTRVESVANIENVVASAALGQGLDLESIAGSLSGVQYRPDTFPGLVYRVRKPKATTLIFRSGKMVCAGAKSESRARKAVMGVVDALKQNGVVILGKPEIRIQNIVATAELGGSVDLEKVAYALERTIYDPEQFPGLIHRMEEPNVVILIFTNGRVVCVGAKREEDAHHAVTKLKQKLGSKGLISQG